MTSPGASTGLDGSLRDPALGALPRPVAELLHDCREGDVTIEAVGGATDGEPAAATTSQVAATSAAGGTAAATSGAAAGAAAPTGGDAGSTSAAPSSQVAATSAAPASGTARPRPAERTARAVQCTGRPGTALSDHVVRFIRDRDWADHRRDTFLTAAGPGAPGHGARGRAADGKVVQDDSSRWIAVRAHDQGRSASSTAAAESRWTSGSSTTPAAPRPSPAPSPPRASPRAPARRHPHYRARRPPGPPHQAHPARPCPAD
ncbi:hypothetical protein I6I09_08110 [Corynebacterium bovis]|uniref:hypothetical protein n=1 Tax=Corynebacterium bovis TaxID=36808 RepID=UPI0018E17CB0|nr:hypothetical protein [Corynebacterium bovis]QQC47032.1 hypothetical protein I6I09_08110 [Corynebacterium bovis]